MPLCKGDYSQAFFRQHKSMEVLCTCLTRAFRCLHGGGKAGGAGMRTSLVPERALVVSCT